jgi:hypothetical protein
MAIQSLENLDLDDEQQQKKIIPSEPDQGEEVSTFVQFQNDVTGEITTLDKKIPRLNLGQKSGALGESMGFGNIILNKEIVLAPFGKMITATALKIRKRFQERRPYDPNSTTQPAMFDTVKAAHAAGFATEWPPGQLTGHEKLALPVADILWFIPASEDLDANIVEQNFFYSYKDVRYAAAAFRTSVTGFNTTARTIFTFLDTPKAKEAGLRVGNWKLMAEKQQNAKNSWFNLKLISNGFNSPEFVKYTKEVLP